MKRIHLFPENSTIEEMCDKLDVDELNRINKWLCKLPIRSNGELAYRIGSDWRDKNPYVVFARDKDAITFRLTFGL